MKKIYLLIFPVFFLCFFFSCKHEPILPTQQVSFQSDIVPILRGSCQHAGCHSPYDPTAEFPLDSVISDVLEYVDTEKPKKSKLYEVIIDQNGDDRMPQPPYDPLTKRQIDFIYIWIAQGAKDN